jgi:hypothetical protein
MKKVLVCFGLAGVLFSMWLIWNALEPGDGLAVEVVSEDVMDSDVVRAAADADSRKPVKETEAIKLGKENAANDSDDETPAADPADEEALRVEAFDALTDQWMEPSKNGVSFDQVTDFLKTFGSVPEDSKTLCLQRALNLIPDENVTLLAGVLFDKSQEKERMELVFNDILNRVEECKMPIIRQVFKDTNHPCWSNAAWILDAMGQVESQTR